MGGFLNSAMLWASLGLLIPLAIHLWNRKQLQVQKVGSIRLYQAEDSPKARNVLFSEALLWLLRSILVGLMVCILAEPFILFDKKPVAKDEEWILVEPALYPVLQNQWGKEKVKMLSEGFPDAKDFDASLEDADNYWALLYGLSESEEKPEKLKVYTQALRRNYKGKSPSLKFEVDWNIIPIENINTNVAINAWVSNDTVSVLKAEFDQEIIEISHQIYPNLTDQSSGLWVSNGDSLPIHERPILDILIVADQAAREESRNLHSAFDLIQSHTLLRFNIDMDTSTEYGTKYDWVFILSDSFTQSGPSLEQAVWRNPNAISTDWFQMRQSGTHIYHELAGRILEVAQPEDKLSRLPEALLDLLSPSMAMGPMLAEKDPRPLSLDELGNTRIEEGENKVMVDELFLVNGLWLFFITVFVIERIISIQRKQ